MSVENENVLPQAALVQANVVVANAIKVAKAAQDLASKAPKAAPDEEVKKAAELLVSHGYLDASRLAEAQATLSDPAMAIKALQNVVLKSAEAVRSDPRLASGQSVPASNTRRTGGPTMKQSSEVESEADRMYLERVATYRNNGVHRM